MTTIREVAKHARVSETTVTLAFREGSRISDMTRQRVLGSAKKLGYVPDLTARALRTGNTRTIGMILPDITNPFYSRMARQVECVAAQLGYQTLLAESQNSPQREYDQLTRMFHARICGMVACFTDGVTGSIQALEQRKLPHIALDVCPPDYCGPYVINDLVAAAELAARHLAETGKRHPCMLVPCGSEGTASAFIDLQKGFSAGCRKWGLRFSRRAVIDSSLTIDGGKRAFAEMRRITPFPDAALCANDLCALGLMESAEEAGLTVGSDFGIIGIDNLDISALARLGLTSIRQPDADLARQATAALIEGIESGGIISIRKRHAPELVIRDSTKPSGEHPAPGHRQDGKDT